MGDCFTCDSADTNFDSLYSYYVCRLEEKTLVESLLNFVPMSPPVPLRTFALSAQVRMMNDDRPKMSMVQGSFDHINHTQAI